MIRVEVLSDILWERPSGIVRVVNCHLTLATIRWVHVAVAVREPDGNPHGGLVRWDGSGLVEWHAEDVRRTVDNGEAGGGGAGHQLELACRIDVQAKSTATRSTEPCIRYDDRERSHIAAVACVGAGQAQRDQLQNARPAHYAKVSVVAEHVRGDINERTALCASEQEALREAHDEQSKGGRQVERPHV